MQLISDVVSHCNDRKVYGRAGDKVKVISDYGNVLIVENESGFRFSVKKTELAEEVKVKTLEAAPDTAVPDITIINRVPVSKKKAAPLNQTKLF